MLTFIILEIKSIGGKIMEYPNLLDVDMLLDYFEYAVEIPGVKRVMGDD